MSDRLRAMFCDHLSIMCGKYLPASKIDDSGTWLCSSIFEVHYDKDLLPAPGGMMLEGLPDMGLRWSRDDIRDSWDQGIKIVLGDLYDHEGAPLGLCPRGALKRAVAAVLQAARLGLEGVMIWASRKPARSSKKPTPRKAQRRI